MKHSGLPVVGLSDDAPIYPTFSDAAARPGLRVVDPATGVQNGWLPMADHTDIAQAVQTARRAIGTDNRRDRITILARLIDAMQARHEALAQAVSQEIGAPIDFARDKQVNAAIAHLEVLLDAARAEDSRIAAAPALAVHSVRYQPLGVAALITPWNWPLNQIALKVGAALAAGCVMILKPSEHAPLSAALFAECMQEAGAGAGIFTMLQGDGSVGAALVEAPGIDVISFTGSTDVGRAIASAAGARLRPVLLELGGKSPNLLFADCDLPLAVQQGVAHCFRNSGQSCNAASRMLVQAEIYDTVVELAAQEAETYRFGMPDAPGSHLGPLVSQAQFDRVQRCINEALEDGARLMAGGAGRSVPGTGYFPRATVFSDVTPQMRLFHEEVFGPVLSISRFEDEAEANQLANNSVYGLAGYIQTASRTRASRVADALDVGMVQINGNSRAPGAPFGGQKASGFGREAGLWGIRAFQTIKSVSGV